MNALGLEGAWSFSYNDNFETVPMEVTLAQSQDRVVFTVPWGIKGMVIELTSYDKEKKLLKGKYVIKDIDSSDEVIFRINEKGKSLEGIPNGFHGRKIWTMEKK